MTELISSEQAFIAFKTLLNTNNNQQRKAAHDWIINAFKPSLHAWSLLPEMLFSCPMLVEKSEAYETCLLASQILYQKLLEDVEQIYNSPETATEIYRSLISWCFELSVKQGKIIGSGLSFKMAECLALAIINFYGLCWETPLSNIMCLSATQSGDQASYSSYETCAKRFYVVHVIAILPELTSSIESRRTFMRLLGYFSYTSWRKTPIGVYLKQEVCQVERFLKNALKVSIAMFNDSTLSTDVYLHNVCSCIIQDCCHAISQWCTTFNYGFFVSTPEDYSYSVLQDLLCTNSAFLRLPVVTEMLSAAISNIQVPKSLFRFSLDSTDTSYENLFDKPLSPQDFEGTTSLFFPLFAALANIVFPFLKSTLYPAKEQLNHIDVSNKNDIISFAYLWAMIACQIVVTVPFLVTHQTQALCLHSESQDPSLSCVLPANFFVQLINLFSYFLPQTFQKIQTIWQDISDLANDKILCEKALRLWLMEVAPVTLRCMLTFIHRDHQQWNADTANLAESDPESRETFIDSCQDTVVTLYYLYQRISFETGYTMLSDLSRALAEAVDSQNYGAAAAVLHLWSALVESMIEPLDTPVLHLLKEVTLKVPSDSECITILSRMIGRLCLCLSQENHPPLWTLFLERMVFHFAVNPECCSESLYILCDTGSQSVLNDHSALNETVNSFFTFLETQSRTISNPLRFLPLLYGALACLIRALPESTGPERFAFLLSPITRTVQDAVNSMNLNPVDSVSLVESLVLSFRCVARAFSALNLHPSCLSSYAIGQSSLGSAPSNSIKCVSYFLFSTKDSLSVVKSYFEAANLLLQKSLTVDPILNIALPVRDCFQASNADKLLWTPVVTFQSINHVVIHVLRLFVAGVPLDYSMEFWRLLLKELPEYHYKNQRLANIDGSFTFLFSDTAAKISCVEKESDVFGLRQGKQNLEILDVYRIWADSFRNLILPLMVAKAQHLDVKYWSQVLKPFFSLLFSSICLSESSSDWCETSLNYIVPLLIKALSGSSSKIHLYCWECFSCLLKSKHPTCEKIIFQFYNDLVEAFWCSCHMWDLTRITPAIAFLNALIHWQGDPQGTQRFMQLSWELWNERDKYTDETGKLYKQLNIHDMRLLLDLLRCVHGVRLRQVVMDIIKIAQHLATPDCLLSYQFLTSYKEREAKTHMVTVE